MRHARTFGTVAVVVAVLLAAVPFGGIGAVAAAIDGQPKLDATLPDNRVTPGEDTTLQVTVFNQGEIKDVDLNQRDFASRVTTARGLTVTLKEDDVPFEVKTNKRAVGSLGEGATQPLGFDIVVKDDARPRPYPYDLQVKFDYTYTSRIKDTGEEVEKSLTRTVEVPVIVEDDAQLSVVNVSSDARVGSTGTVAVTFENTGTERARDATLELESKNSAVSFGDSATASRSLGTWLTGEQRTLEYEMSVDSSANTESYTFDATLDYEDRDGIPLTTDTQSFGIRPEPEQTFDIGNVSSQLGVGEEGTLEGSVVNTGGITVSNAVVTFETTKETVTAIENESPVGTLAPGESGRFSIPIEISESARAGPQQFSLSVEYRDDDGDIFTSDSIAVQEDVAEEIRKFRLETNRSTVEPGSGTELEVTVTNDGSERFTDISANMFADSPMSVTDDEAFIGSLGPGESETVTFSVGAAGGALEKSYPVSLDFQYDEPDGDTKLSRTYKIPISVERPEDSGGGGPPVLLIVGALLVVGVGAYLYRRRG